MTEVSSRRLTVTSIVVKPIGVSKSTLSPPTNDCKKSRKIVMIEKTFVCFISRFLQAWIAFKKITNPNTVVNIRWEYSINILMSLKSGTNCPLHFGQSVPQASPELVATTRFPRMRARIVVKIVNFESEFFKINHPINNYIYMNIFAYNSFKGTM